MPSDITSNWHTVNASLEDRIQKSYICCSRFMCWKIRYPMFICWGVRDIMKDSKTWMSSDFWWQCRLEMWKPVDLDGVIYYMSFKTYNQLYIRKTKRRSGDHFAEHLPISRIKDFSFSVVRHFNRNAHDKSKGTRRTFESQGMNAMFKHHLLHQPF